MKGDDLILTGLIGTELINCFDGKHPKEQLKLWAGKKIIICPACGSPYEYCHGRIKTPYFRHSEKDSCEDKYSESETQEHINGKLDLYLWIKTQKGVYDVKLEGWLPSTKQRPDIMFKYKNKQYVIEYQCTPIASEYLERHDLYQASGISDIWICGTSKYMADNMRTKELEKYCVGYYSHDSKLFYFSETNEYPIYDYFNAALDGNINEACGVYDAIDEHRMWFNHLATQLSNLHFSGCIHFKNYKNVDKGYTIDRIRNNRYRYRKDSVCESIARKLSNYLKTKLQSISFQNWAVKIYPGEIGLSDTELVIDLGKYESKYGTLFVNKKWTVTIDSARYSQLNILLIEIKHFIRELMDREDKISRSLYYFSNKEKVHINIINNDTQLSEKKYFRICKGNKDYSVSEFIFLEDFIRCLQSNKKYSKEISIKIPNNINGILGNLSCKYSYSSKESEHEIYYYFKRLGFEFITFEN